MMSARVHAMTCMMGSLRVSDMRLHEPTAQHLSRAERSGAAHCNSEVANVVFSTQSRCLASDGPCGGFNIYKVHDAAAAKLG